MMRFRSCCLVAAAALADGCSQMPALPAIPTLTPYKMDVQQGNVVTQDMVEKLKPGMTPSQVRFILGTPLVVDAFHKDRWDYVYRFSKRGTLQESRRIVVVFKDDKLASIEGDVVPAQPGSTEGGVTIAPAPGKPASGKPRVEKSAPEVAAPTAPAAKPEPEAGGSSSSPAGSASSPAAPASSAAVTAPGSDAATSKPERSETEEPR